MPQRCSVCGRSDGLAADAAFCPHCGGRLSAAPGGPPAGEHAPAAAIELSGVCKSFDGHVVLNQLSLRVPRGESLVVVGMSGSGKSVLMEHIIGFQSPDAGSVRIMGQDPCRGAAAGAEIGMVFQGSALIDSLSVRDNVLLPLARRGIPAAEARRRAEAMLQAVGLLVADGDLAPAQLSGGMQKRVGIARALVSSPAVLLYDEPTTGLDAATSAAISRLMRLVQEQNPGLTSITITHDYLSGGILADRVLYLDRESGQLQEVLSRAAIDAIRGRHGPQSAAAVSEIRDRLEAFFNQLDLGRRRPPAPRTEGTWLAAFGAVAGGVFKLIGAALLLLPQAAVHFDLPAVLRRMYQVGVQSMLVTCSAGAFVGMILAHQIGLGLSGAGVLDPLPRIVGLAIVDKLGPLVVGLLLAGRIGASVSAEIGGKRLSRQFDALRAMGISPQRYWLAPILWASVLSLPLLTLALEVSAAAGAYAVATMLYHVNSSFFLDQVLEDVGPLEFLFGMLRGAVFGAAVALIAYAKGAEEKRSSDEIGQATTVAVSAASVSVIALDFMLVFVMPRG